MSSMFIYKLKQIVAFLNEIYVKSLHQTNSTVLTIVSHTKRAKMHFIAKISLFEHVIYTSACLHCWQFKPVQE